MIQIKLDTGVKTSFKDKGGEIKVEFEVKDKYLKPIK